MTRDVLIFWRETKTNSEEKESNASDEVGKPQEMEPDKDV